ncbi:hypothetical protein KUA24_146 [Vibrio phage HNL01]|nr:hypothetical protein KUA24_146 [Vibrio phage HNL01]
MAKFEPKHFSKTLEGFAKEVLPPKVIAKHGAVRALRMMDQRILEFLDEFRYDAGVPLTVNTPWNGQFTQSGQRDDEFYNNSFEDVFWSLSDHTFGRGLDVKCKHGGAWLRKKFIEREQHYYEKYGINFVECGPLKGNKTMSWAHFSLRIDLEGCVQYWSPVTGFVTKEQVLENNW